MTSKFANAVLDVSPWPAGRGFAGSRAWWDYVLTKNERQRLDSLMGLALLDKSVRERLLSQSDAEADDSLFAAFGISEATQQWLRSIKVASLEALAEAILDHASAQCSRIEVGSVEHSHAEAVAVELGGTTTFRMVTPEAA